MAKKVLTTNQKRIRIIFNILLLIACIIGAYFLGQYMFTTVPIRGSSMEPTLLPNDTVMLYKPEKNYRYGDIVIFNTHQQAEDGEGERHYVKRIIGMPGDTIIFKRSSSGQYRVFRNGIMLEEKYLDRVTDNDQKYVSAQSIKHVEIKVPEGKFYYMGDNRANSSDSSTSGQMSSLKDIVGRVILRYGGKSIFNDAKAIKREKKQVISGVNINERLVPAF